MLSRRIVQSRTSNLDLDVPGCLGNIDRLDTHLTIDNVRFAPCAYLVADDINGGTGAWASRHDASKILSVAGSGADPTYGNATAIENSSVKYAAAKYHKAADTTWGQVTTGDYAIELVIQITGNAEAFLYSRQSVASTVGYWVYSSGNAIVSGIGDGTNNVTTSSLTTITTGAIAHVFIAVDKTEKQYLYINGVYANSADVSSVTNTMLAAGGFAVGSYPDGTSPFGGSILHVGIWNLSTSPFPGALKNRTYFDKIARERFAIVAGIQDSRQGAHTFTRATPAYLDKWIPATSTRGLYRVSAGWPRICERDDANSKRVRRFLGEPQITNLCIQSEDLATTWTALDLTTINSNAAVAPNGETTADGVVANVTNTAHGVYQPLTLPATNHCLSVFAKPGNKNWIELYTSIANVRAHFDVANGTVGTTGASVTAAGVESHPYLNGHYRCWICFTGTANAKDYGFFSATSDGNTQFAGDTTTVNTYFWGAQIEATAELFPSSYIPTAAASVARNKDELSYNVRLPIVGNLNDLPQALTIGGSDYDPCAYLVADDCQDDGTWMSRHAAKSLAFAGAGTNPTPQWDAVSRANKSIKYWANNYHTAADTTWGQVTTGDWAFELIFVPGTTTTGMAFSTYNGSTAGLLVYWNGTAVIVDVLYNSTEYARVTGSVLSGQLCHVFCGSDYSDAFYTFVNGTYVNNKSLAGATGSGAGSALTLGAHPSGAGNGNHGIASLGIWDLPANPWPGAATNQAVMGAIARARFDQLFQPIAMRLDCEILHPNVNRQTKVSLVDISVNQLDYNSLMIDTDDYGLAQAAYNNTWSWNSSTTKGSTDVCDNVSRKLSIAARENNARYKEDNTTVASDTSCEVPTAHTTVRVGMWADNNFQPSCLVGGVKLWRSDK